MFVSNFLFILCPIFPFLIVFYCMSIKQKIINFFCDGMNNCKSSRKILGAFLAQNVIRGAPVLC